MPRTIDVHLLPALVEPHELAGKAVVVIDVLRATTTIIHALAAGAKEVIPLLEVEEARQIAAKMPGQAVLGGERGGQRIEGFELGNSPLEYTSAAVGGKTLIFTTTNGTRAMLRCKQARRILIAGFVNFSAVCRELAEEEQIDIVCAGTDGHVTREDTLLAGAIVEEAGQALRNDQAEIAADAWRTAVGTLSGRDPLAAALRESRGGRNLIEIGQGDDIDLAAQIDRFDIVPELDIAAWRIRS
ncbi:MAG: 2-phosphosulfolactate phosphatase [Planctomycetales bacterium]|nr:2-phosphosulfolactate phosphatase [Planctomycetales bacterium]